MSEIILGQVSILVPSYNHSQFIERCLNSISEDSYSNKQLIIIDDGSKDKSVEIIEKWIEINQKFFSNPIIFRSRKNKGLTKTLNEMLEIATGEYILTIASDDYLINNSINKRVEFLTKYPEKHAVFSDCIVVDNDDNLIYNSGIEDLYNGNKYDYESEKSLSLSIILRWCIPGPVIMLKRKAFEIIGKYDEEGIAEDRSLYLRLVSKNVLIFLNEKVSAYRLHQNNFIKNAPIELSHEAIRVELKLFKNFKGINRVALMVIIGLRGSRNMFTRFFYKVLNKCLIKFFLK